MKSFDDLFPKLAVCDNGKFSNLMPHFKHRDIVKGVYLILFPSGDEYIGTSKHLHNRIWQHYWGMRSGKHCLPQLVKAYRSNNETFDIFQLSRGEYVNIDWEQAFIFALKANLNRIVWGSHVHVNELRDIAVIIGCDVMDFFRDEATHQPEQVPDNSITCHHCGKKITFRGE